MRQSFRCAVQLPLQRANQATERLCGSQQQRVVKAGPVITRLARGKRFALPTHSKLLLVGPVALSAALEQGVGQAAFLTEIAKQNGTRRAKESRKSHDYGEFKRAASSASQAS